MITPIGALSYPALFTPDQYNANSTPRYKAELVFDKGQDLSELERHLASKVAEKWPDPAKRPATLMKKWPIKDLEDGTRSLRSATKRRPRIFDASQNDIHDESVMYPGARVRFNGFAWAYDDGVSFVLDQVQRVGDGTRILGDDSASEAGCAFPAIEGEGVAAPGAGRAELLWVGWQQRRSDEQVPLGCPTGLPKQR